MSSPRCGWLHAFNPPDTAARSGPQLILVLSEDLWNEHMHDSVIVPVYANEDEREGNRMYVQIEDKLWADCTKVQSMDHRLIGAAKSKCQAEPWVRTRVGVREFVDIDRRIDKRAKPAPSSGRETWWPRQEDIHFVENSAIGPADKLYAVISDDDWNSALNATYASCVRLTSKTKPQRARWEVPIAGSWVVSGDLYSLAYHRFEQSAPRDDYPKRITPDESSALAAKQKTALTL